MIEVKCTHCGAVQKADENKYEVACKKCGEPFVVEDGLELLLAGGGPDPVAAPATSDPAELREKGLNALDAGEYAMAKTFLSSAAAALPQDAEVAWGLCRATMCAPAIDPTEEDILYARGERDEAIGRVAQQRGIPPAKTEYEIRTRLRKFACFTDEESDALFEAASEIADEAFRERIDDLYTVYSYRQNNETLEEETHSYGFADRFRDIRPNFGKQRSLVDVKVILALILSVAVIVGASVMIALDLYNGWIIALLVVGILASLICALILWMDSKKTLLWKVIDRYSPTHVEDIVRALYNVKTDEQVQALVPNILGLLFNMIAAGQLTFVGVRGGEKLLYYDNDCNLINIDDDTDEPAATADGEAPDAAESDAASAEAAADGGERQGDEAPAEQTDPADADAKNESANTGTIA